MILCLSQEIKKRCIGSGHQAKLKALYELQKEFTSTVSHELRTPLASIKTAIDLVVRGMVGEIWKEQEEILVRAKNNVDRLKRLIDDILDLTKMESGKMRLNLIGNDINKVIKEVVDAQKDVAASRGLYLKMELDAHIPVVSLDSDRINQVMNNLLNNALKFTKQGGVNVASINKEDRNHIIVEVRDTGPGIAKGDLNKIFKKFQFSSHHILIFAQIRTMQQDGIQKAPPFIPCLSRKQEEAYELMNYSNYR